MNAAERVVRAIDGYQQRRRPLAFLFGVVKKFGDDRGGALAALLTYYGFLSLFPLLLLLVTALGFVVGNDPHLQQRLLHSALTDFPIIGVQIQSNIHALRANGFGLAVGVVGLLWGALGITQVGQHAMQEVWNVPGVQRPGFPVRLWRGLKLLGVLGLGVGATSVLAGLGSQGTHASLTRVGLILASVPVNIGLFVVGFRVLTGPRVPLRDHVPGAVVAGAAWSGLQALGGYLVAHQLRHASQVYGFFGVVLGLVSWIFLVAQITIYAAEVNAVRAQKLWPRSIVQPPLTAEDERALAAIARREERRPEEKVEVTFEQDA
ncbi:MAG: YihY/virulence factor BrkB family protein [Acidimicrobiia bacterium]|nr:YihY/virulence factor BrkB family protein [Acidimicrobiia bacterium]